MGGYAAKTFFHLALGLYMLYWNRRWDKEARERGEVLSDEERSRRAEEVGMVSGRGMERQVLILVA